MSTSQNLRNSAVIWPSSWLVVTTVSSMSIMQSLLLLLLESVVLLRLFGWSSDADDISISKWCVLSIVPSTCVDVTADNVQ